MIRLIDADRSIEIVRNQAIAHPHAYHLTNYATRVLQEAPTVDAVPVVRCKDCKWLYGVMDNYCCINHRGLVEICENSFCSYGERKDGDGNG